MESGHKLLLDGRECYFSPGESILGGCAPHRGRHPHPLLPEGRIRQRAPAGFAWSRFRAPAIWWHPARPRPRRGW